MPDKRSRRCSRGEALPRSLFSAPCASMSRPDVSRADPQRWPALGNARISGGRRTFRDDSSDLSGLTLDPDDLKALKTCREGACDVQLPTSSITAFQNAVDWGKPDAGAGQANGLARGMVLDLVRAYRRGGNTALGVYRDKDHPARVTDQFETMVGR